MHRHFFSLRIAALVVLAAIAVASLDLALNGFVVVHDPDDRIVVAELRGTAGVRPMRRFANGYWATRPTIEGVIAVTCRNGVVSARDHVTSGLRVTRTITAADCRRR